MNGIRLRRALTLDDYVQSVIASNQFAGRASELSSLKLGLFGEIGEILSGMKKTRRDALTDAEARGASEEIGDALWYLLAIAHKTGVSPAALTVAALKEIACRVGAEPPKAAAQDSSIRRMVGYVNAHCGAPSQGSPTVIPGLSERVGALVGTRRIQKPALAALFADLAMLAHDLRLDLELVAVENVAKIKARWPDDLDTPTPLFDSACSVHEQLPRKLWVRFEERNVRGVNYVYISVNGVSVGDRLTDNSHEPDDYRFHDVFHLAYAAYLGWSPVLRSLLKVKRKSSAKLDENEDGARAIIIEEGVSTWMFNIGRDHLFTDVTQQNFPYSLLKQISGFVKGYEVERSQPWEWARAILKGFEVFRQLKDARRGYVIADLESRSIVFKSIEEIDESIEHKEVRRKAGNGKAAGSVQPVRGRLHALRQVRKKSTNTAGAPPGVP
jgi:NTP pyrophosphatase (non-canonical NTP hydrolase)